MFSVKDHQFRYFADACAFAVNEALVSGRRSLIYVYVGGKPKEAITVQAQTRGLKAIAY